jgi:hypothetical protein
MALTKRRRRRVVVRHSALWLSRSGVGAGSWSKGAAIGASDNLRFVIAILTSPTGTQIANRFGKELGTDYALHVCQRPLASIQITPAEVLSQVCESTLDRDHGALSFQPAIVDLARRISRCAPHVAAPRGADTAHQSRWRVQFRPRGRQT